MKKGRILIIILFAGVLAGAGYVYSQLTSYHNFKGRCLECHLLVPGPGEVPRTFMKDITRMCVDCHKAEQELSHPVDLTPSMQVPEALPLDWKGQITCVTCHGAHNPGFGPSRLRVRASGQSFCSICHNDLEGGLHQSALGTAHIGRTQSSNFVPWESGSVLDDLSIRCMACHDATFGGDTLVENPDLRGTIFHNANEIGLSHPIGVSYLEARRKYQGAYRTLDKVPAQVKLFGGMIGCGTCHNPYSKQHFELVMSNEGSALCLGCHIK